MPQRTDARRNRALLIRAAEEAFREIGPDASLVQVARRAGVGHGTLYRHFPDRTSLVAAMLEERYLALECYVASLPPGRLLEHLLVEVTRFQLEVPGLFTRFRATVAHSPEQAALERRTLAMLERALDEARAAGELQPGVTLADAVLVFAMADGVVAGSPVLDGAQGLRRMLDLVRPALLTAPRCDEPLPVPRLGHVGED